jgi:hypothetical protein
MNTLILILLLLAQGEVAPGGFRFSGRILREGFSREQTPPPLTIRLTQIGQEGRAAAPKAFTDDVAADGSFEFSGLTPGLYSLYLFPDMQPSAMSIPFVNIDADIGDFWLTVPLSAMTVTVTATVTLEGIGPMPSFEVALTNTDRSPPGAERKSGPVGNTITISEVPVGEYAVRLTDLPEGYSIKSITEDSTNLQAEKLRVHPASPPHIKITLMRTR